MEDTRGWYTYAYDEVSAMRSATSPLDKSISYTFEAVDQRSKMVDPDGGRFTYSYHAATQLIWLSNPQVERTSFSYDAAGRRSVKCMANGRRASFTYDAADQLTLLGNRNSDSSVISSFDYAYDAIGNRTRVVEVNGDRAEHRSSVNACAQAFTCDASDSRTLKKENESRITYTYDVTNQLQSAV